MSGRGRMGSADATAGALEELGGALALDLVLRKRGFEFGLFMEELYDKGVTEMASAPRELSGLFFVKRKDARLRLIWDTRCANCHFEAPPTTHMASGESLSDIEVPAGRGLKLASGDIDACFYQYELPGDLRPCFMQPEVERRLLKSSFPKKLGLEAQGPAVSFQARVVPMGWSWAVYLMQAAHHKVLRSVASGHAWVVDKVPAPPLTQGSVLKVLYIDNVAAIALEEGPCERALSNMLEAFEQKCVVAHRDPWWTTPWSSWGSSS